MVQNEAYKASQGLVWQLSDSCLPHAQSIPNSGNAPSDGLFLCVLLRFCHQIHFLSFLFPLNGILFTFFNINVLFCSAWDVGKSSGPTPEQASGFNHERAQFRSFRLPREVSSLGTHELAFTAGFPFQQPCGLGDQWLQLWL